MSADDRARTAEKILAGITAGDLRRQLEIFPDDADLFIGGLSSFG